MPCVKSDAEARPSRQAANRKMVRLAGSLHMSAARAELSFRLYTSTSHDPAGKRPISVNSGCEFSWAAYRNSEVVLVQRRSHLRLSNCLGDRSIQAVNHPWGQAGGAQNSVPDRGAAKRRQAFGDRRHVWKSRVA